MTLLRITSLGPKACKRLLEHRVPGLEDSPRRWIERRVYPVIRPKHFRNRRISLNYEHQLASQYDVHARFLFGHTVGLFSERLVTSLPGAEPGNGDFRVG